MHCTDTSFLCSLYRQQSHSKKVIANLEQIGAPIVFSPLLRQLFPRPLGGWNPYTTPHPKLLCCSRATPRGAGMCGYHAARTILRKAFEMRPDSLPSDVESWCALAQSIPDHGAYRTQHG